MSIPLDLVIGMSSTSARHGGVAAAAGGDRLAPVVDRFLQLGEDLVVRLLAGRDDLEDQPNVAARRRLERLEELRCVDDAGSIARGGELPVVVAQAVGLLEL